MDHLPSTEDARPWWADVAHLRDETGRAAEAPVVRDRRARDEERPAPAPLEMRGRQRAPAGRGRPIDRPKADWFADEARTAGRRTRQLPTGPTRPARPRATLVDVSPDHAFMRRAQQVRRAPGERPTVTITGRPEAALPPAVRPPQHLRARRTRERATSLVASPDRMILWAVALGLLMILASIGTANASALHLP